MSHPVDVTPKQRIVLDHLLHGEPVTRAAAEAGVSTRQVHRWLKDDNFTAALHAAQAVMMDAVISQLVDAAPGAVRVLVDYSENPPTRQDAPGAAVAVRAAVALLDSCLRWKETLDFDSRLERLEREVLK